MTILKSLTVSIRQCKEPLQFSSLDSYLWKSTMWILSQIMSLEVQEKIASICVFAVPTTEPGVEELDGIKTPPFMLRLAHKLLIQQSTISP